jgi:folate-binding protein YgfZ
MDPSSRETSAPPASASTLIRVEGPDALDFLHRISTQSLIDLARGAARFTLFCDFRGRLLHRSVVAHASDGAVWIARDDAGSAELIEYLERHRFREDVRIADASDSTMVTTRAESGEGAATDAAADLDFVGRVLEHDGRPRTIAFDSGYAIQVEDVGRADPRAIPRAASEAEESRRIAAGRPRHGHEVHPDWNPFEVGLAREVHLNKGCFTGQESLMRLVTYRSVRRGLARVEGDGTSPRLPLEVRRGGEPVGRLTSAAARDPGWIGLAVLKRESLEARDLEIEGARIRSVVPFPERRPLGLP